MIFVYIYYYFKKYQNGDCGKWFFESELVTFLLLWQGTMTRKT